MRPARKGPENPQNLCQNRARRGCFNEAGPQGAGKLVSAVLTRGIGLSRFNEAGPQGAGKPDGFPLSLPQPDRASMRPARKGPENAKDGAQAGAGASASMRPARKGPENA